LVGIRLFLLAGVEYGLCVVFDRSRYKGADVLAHLFRRFRNHIVGGRIEIPDNPMGEAFARSTAFAAVAFLNHANDSILKDGPCCG
jgi:hypothetical protein